MPTRKDGKRKDHSDPKRPPKSNHPQQLQTHNVPNYDVKMTQIREDIYDLLIRKDAASGSAIQESYYTTNAFSKTAIQDRKSSHGMDRQQKRYMIWSRKAG